MLKVIATVLLSTIACVDAPAPDAPAPPYANPCCALGAEEAGACFAAELPAGTCAEYRCPEFVGAECGPPKPEAVLVAPAARQPR
jgi:hypothetical protein